MALPKISVVILNWNGQKFLEQFLPSVFLSKYPNYEVVVADNASNDNSISFLEKNYPLIQIIPFKENYGFSKGYNKALQQIKSDYYVLLNSDVEVTKDWLEPMLSLLESDPSIAACQPKLLSFRQKDLFEYAGAAGGWLDKYGYPFAKGRVFDVCEKDHGQYDQSEPVFWASGAALFIRADIFHDVRGFDEFFFAHQEEIDLCWRMQLAGHKVYSCPSSVVYHVGGGTLAMGSPKKTWLNFRNNKIMLSKNLPFPRNLWIMVVRDGLDAVSAWKGLLTGHPRYFLAVIRAHISFYNWWLFYRSRSVFPRKKHNRLDGYLQRNIAWLYFVKKKRTFSEIVAKNE